MKKTKMLAVGLVVSGMIVLGMGLAQQWDFKLQEQKSLQTAKELVEDSERKNSLPQDFKVDNGEAAGLLLIPKIGAELPIVEGTNPDDLEKGVGHFRKSYYPDENGQIVFSGHRDTVFRRTGELEIGDILTVNMPYGDYTYEIISTKVVPADDTSIITLQNSREELILTTCYPFNYIGNAPDRYIMYAKRVSESKD